MASLRKIGQTYYIRYRINGKEFSKKIGKNLTKSVALKLLQKFEEKIALKKLGLREPEVISISGMLNIYLEWVSKNQAPKTYEIKKGARKNFETFLNLKENQHIIYLHDLSPHIIERYKIHRLNQNVTNRTINIELNFLSNLISTAKEWNYQITDFKIKRLRESKKIPRYFSQEETNLILNNSSKYLHQIITISLFTGLRINELLNLQWKNIDFINNQIHISNNATFKTKTRKDRIIPLHSYLKQYLQEMKTHFVDPNTDKISPRASYQTTYVISSKNGGKVGCVRKAYKRLLDRLNIQNASLHTLRHTFASMCIMNNVDLYTIKEFLGHSRVTTTEIYTHINQKFKQNNIEKLIAISPSLPHIHNH